MENVCVSAKVPREVSERLSSTRYATSDVVQIGLQLFLNLSCEQQTSLMWNHLQAKKRQRAIEKYTARVKLRDERLDM